MNVVATNFEQSKKLAKVLPISSADMWYDIGYGRYPVNIPQINYTDFIPDGIYALAAWSLDALLDVIKTSKIDGGCDINRFNILYEKENRYSLIIYWLNKDGESCDGKTACYPTLIDVAVETVIWIYNHQDEFQ